MRIVYATREGVFEFTEDDAARTTFFVGDAALVTDERWKFEGANLVPDQDYFDANNDR